MVIDRTSLLILKRTELNEPHICVWWISVQHIKTPNRSSSSTENYNQISMDRNGMFEQ